MLYPLLLVVAPAADPSDRIAADNAQLYDEVCLRAFPDDEAVRTIMAARGARELTPEEVRVTMRDDPATGWQIANSRTTVWLEFPPYHACSVRWGSPSLPDLAPYKDFVAKFAASSVPFAPIAPMDLDRGALHIHAVGQRRVQPDGAVETLFVIDQHVTDPARRAQGETGYSVRFVRQLAMPVPVKDPKR